MMPLLPSPNQLSAPAAARRSREELANLGQFLTPEPVARLMASLLVDLPTEIHALDAGAGTGNLCVALCAEVASWARPPDSIHLNAYEIDEQLGPALTSTLERCAAKLIARGGRYSSQIYIQDFLAHAVAQLSGAAPTQRVNCALVNPPYRKIRSDSEERRLLRSVGIETSNLYSGFLSLIIRLLEPGGVLCAICPRSFCNGPYFLPFRRLLTESTTLVRIHEFTARDRAFAGDSILQETVIFTAVKRAIREPRVFLSQSTGPEAPTSCREVSYSAVILPGDEARILHLPRAPVSAAALPYTLSDLGVTVSTGRVVDFRAKDDLRHKAARDTVPLLYPAHLRNGQVLWPLPAFRKPQHIQISNQSQPQLLPVRRYVLVKRFSSKEQRRRVVAACCGPDDLPAAQFCGFENHLNVLSGLDESLPVGLARGLCAFLNSTQLDHAFRLFSGHTQVNAADLRRLRFPSRAALLALARALPRANLPDQDELDELVAIHAGLPPLSTP